MGDVVRPIGGSDVESDVSMKKSLSGERDDMRTVSGFLFELQIIQCPHRHQQITGEESLGTPFRQEPEEIVKGIKNDKDPVLQKDEVALVC